MQFSEDFVCNDEQKMKIHFSSEYMYRKVANSSRSLLVAAPLVNFFNLLSKIGP